MMRRLDALRQAYLDRGFRLTPQTPVLLNSAGRPMNPDTFTARIRRLYDELGMSKQYHLHTPRHFAATYWLESNTSKQVVASILGHGDTGFLERTYCHPQLTAKAEAANRAMNLLVLPGTVDRGNRPKDDFDAVSTF